MNPVKVMIITMSTYGGIIHYTSQLANNLHIAGAEITILAPRGLSKNNFVDNIKIIEMDVGNNIKNLIINSLNLKNIFKYIKMIHQENPDVIHCIEEWNLWLGFILFFIKKFPIITTIHDVNPHYGTRKIDKNIAKYFHIKFSDSLIVHGSNAKAELKTNKECHIIPHGDYSFFTKFKKGNIVEEKNTVLFFGRIEEYKGLIYLIEAINRISEYLPDIKLIIAGSGEFSKYEKIMKNEKNFEVHNRFIADEEVPNFFQRSNFVILPYIEGTQTGIIPIAYAFKKPVIVTDVGSIPEVVENGKTGFIVPHKNELELEKAIMKLLQNDDLRKSMGINAHIKMENELSWDIIAESTMHIYQELISIRENR